MTDSTPPNLITIAAATRGVADDLAEHDRVPPMIVVKGMTAGILRFAFDQFGDAVGLAAFLEDLANRLRSDALVAEQIDAIVREASLDGEGESGV